MNKEKLFFPRFIECSVQPDFRQSFNGEQAVTLDAFRRRCDTMQHGPVARRQSAGQGKIDAKFKVSSKRQILAQNHFAHSPFYQLNILSADLTFCQWDSTL
jgi:hypothetical protein